MPDSDTSPVVVQRVVQSMTLARPDTFAGSWDCHIFTLPWADDLSLREGTYYDNPIGVEALQYLQYDNTSNSWQTVTSNNPYFKPTDGNYDTYGMLTAISVPAGTATLPSREAALSPENQRRVSRLSPPVQLRTGKRRLIGWGFEIHDVSSDLVKQGTLTCYRQANTVVTTEAVGLSGKAADDYNPTVPTGRPPSLAPATSTYQMCTLPPGTQAEVMRNTGSRQWEARDGAYVVCRMDLNRNTLRTNSRAYVAAVQGDVMTGLPDVSGEIPALFASSIGTKPVGSYDMAVPQPPLTTFPLPYHTSGVYLTGLNSESTFTITMRTYWEYAPTPNDLVGAALVYLAQPSSDYDGIALELYERASNQLPVGVPVGMNAAGDFWDWVLGAVKTAAPVVGNILLPGGGGAVGSAIGNWAGEYQKTRNATDAEQRAATRAQLMQAAAHSDKAKDFVKRDISQFQANATNIRLPNRYQKQEKKPKKKGKAKAG